MSLIEDKFARLAIDNAPGQEIRSSSQAADVFLDGTHLAGAPVDFSHGDVDEDAFEPTPGALDEFVDGVRRGSVQAYTEYRGEAGLRDLVAERLAAFTGTGLSGAEELIITPGTQGALFLAIAASVAAGDKVAIVEPDYFANRKLVEFMGGKVEPVRLDYLNQQKHAGLDLDQLEAAFAAGARTFLFSNPNNPTGVIYSQAEIQHIATLANRYGAAVIVDQLYCRLLYTGHSYTHLRAMGIDSENVLTIMGPSKTESLSGYRLGVAFGSRRLIDRMEKLQGIVSLRAPGYCQAVLRTWFNEPQGWLENRIVQHQTIRDELLESFMAVDGMQVRRPEAGSYLFPRLPSMTMSLHEVIQILRHHANVTVTPGTEFSPHAGDSIRLNFSQNRETAIQAVKRAIHVIDQYRN